MQVFTINIRIFSRDRGVLSQTGTDRAADPVVSRNTAEIIAVILITGLLFAGLSFLMLEFLNLVIWLMKAVFFETVFSARFLNTRLTKSIIRSTTQVMAAIMAVLKRPLRNLPVRYQPEPRSENSGGTFSDEKAR